MKRLYVSFFIFVCLFGVYFVYGSVTKKNKKEKQCISPTTLRGCEKAGASVEQQLRYCEWAWSKCEEKQKEKN